MSYAATGEIGLQLALPPGYSTAVWPPAGIALAAALIWGWRSGPGIALGALVINFWAGYSSLHGTMPAALSRLSVAVAVGAVLQAQFGRYLLRRFGGHPNALATPREIAKLYLLGGPLASLVNASIGVGTLAVIGALPPDSVPYSWTTWWVGDVTGVFIFTPLFLVWRQPNRLLRRRTPPTAIALLTAFAMTMGLVGYTLSLERHNLAARFADQSGLLAEDLKRALGAQLNAVGAVEALMSGDDPVELDDFRRFSSRIRARTSDMAVLEWVPRVAETDKAAFESWARRVVQPDFSIHDKDTGKASAPLDSGDRFPVTYVDPPNGNQQAIGVDLGSIPTRAETLWSSRDSAAPTLTGRIQLVQDNQPAVFIAIPVYRSGQPPESVERRRLDLKGFALGVVRLRPLIDEAFSRHDLGGVHYWLQDATVPEATVLLASNADGARPDVLRLGGKGLLSPKFVIGGAFPLDVGGRRWILRTTPTAAFVGRNFSHDAWLILLGGLLLTGGVGAVALIITGREHSLRTMVDERTQALAASEQRYRDLFTGSPQPMCVVDQASLRVIDVNDAAISEYGYSREEFLALALADLARCPEAPTEAGKPPASGEHRHFRKDGTAIDVLIWSRDLAGEQGRLCLLVNVSDRKRAEEALARQAARFQALLLTASDGIHVIDMDGDLIEASESFLRMLGYDSPESLNITDWDVGLPRAVLMQQVLPRMFEEPTVLESRHRRRDGRELDVEISARGVVLDGRKYICASARDITERREAEEQAARNLAEALALRNILRLSLGDDSLERILDGALAEVLSLPWLNVAGSGCIFLTEGDALRMVTECNLGADLRRDCATVAVGECLCGQAATTGKVVFGKAPPPAPDVRRESEHEHYCVPISSGTTSLGVLLICMPDGHQRDIDEEHFLVTVAATLAGIIRRKQIETALRSSEELAKTLLNAPADAAVLLDAGGRILASNEAAAAILHHPPETATGQDFFALVEASLAVRRRTEMEMVIASQQPLRLTEERGDAVFDSRIYPVHGPDGKVSRVAIFSRDITEKQRSERKIGELVAYQKALLSNTPIGLAVFSIDRQCLEANDAFCNVFGLTLDSIRGQEATALYRDPEQYADLGRRAYPIVLSGGTFSDDVPMRRRDGTDVWVRLIGHLVEENSPHLGIIWTAEDITERKALENNLKRANIELEQFAYVASHDLRQPLRMVTSYLSLIEKELQGRMDGELTTFFGFAIDGARRMDRLIQDLLQYSRTGRTSSPFAPVPLNEAVAEAMQNLEVSIAENGGRITVAPGLPTVSGDRNDLTRLFQNLIGNAVKYHKPDAVPEIEVGWSRTEREATVWVRDNGIGIAPKDHDRVFGIFQRLVPRAQYEGTGIGLAVCKKIVEHHHGRIWIESDLGQGSTFYTAFPL